MKRFVDKSVLVHDEYRDYRYREIRVAVGILSDKQGMILLNGASCHIMPGPLWEFPGGILERDETSWQALERELQEELGITIERASEFMTVRYKYNDVVVCLDAWMIESYRGEPKSKEGQELVWIDPTAKLLKRLNKANQVIFEKVRQLRDKPDAQSQSSTVDKLYLNIECLKWFEIADRLEKLNPELTEQVSKCKHADKLEVYRVVYHFGDIVVENGKLCLPLVGGGTVPLDNNLVPASVRNALSYNTLPVGVLLSKVLEASLYLKNKAVPIAQCRAGQLFGLTDQYIDGFKSIYMGPYTIYAGSRCVFMLPQISDTVAHNKLKKHYSLSRSVPSYHSDHFNIFKEISANAHEDSEHVWQCEVLFFSKEWFGSDESKKTDEFQHYIKHILINTLYFRPFLDLIWHNFSELLEERSRYPSPFAMAHFKHMIKTLMGDGFMYSPCLEDDILPTKLIQEAYLEHYGLAYVPTIMAPVKYDVDQANPPMYHSLSYPGFLQNVPIGKRSESLYQGLVKIISLYNDFLTSVLSRKLEMGCEFFEKRLNMSRFDYFYPNPDDDSVYSIKPSSRLIEFDSGFLKTAGDNQGLRFSDVNSFSRGCISLVKKG